MNRDKPIIIWEKWKDPFLEKIQQYQESITDEIYEEIYENPVENFEEQETPIKFPMIMTPMGVLPYNENTACGKLFNFWTGHTNFTINKDIGNIIEACEGVETLDIFTRYRFRIAIGKAFNDSKIMRYLNSIIYEYINEHN